MNIVIVGQGAMGLLWYHHIQQLIENSAKYNKAQLRLLASNKSQHQYQQYTFTDHNSLEHRGTINYAKTKNIHAADVIILCLKAFQITSFLTGISHALKQNASVVLAHNGMGTLTELSQSIVDKNNFYSLLTTHGCLRTAPFIVTHTGIGSTDIGLLSGVNDLTQQQLLTTLLDSALPCVTYHEKIKQKQWIKLAINCVINPLTALNNVENGDINRIEYLPTITALLEELIAVANIEGIKLNLVALKQTVANVAQATAKNSSSMRCDVLAKRLSEIDYINGYVHHLGIKHDIATPENTKLWQAVKNLEAKI